MVRTMFTDREGRVILDQGTDREGRVRPTTSAWAHCAQRELRGQRRLQNQQAEHAQPEYGQVEEAQADKAQPEEVQADEAQPEADDGYPGGPVDRSVLRTYGDHVATRLWDDVDRGELRVFSNEKKLKEAVIENQEVEELVKSSGLYTLLKCSYEMIDQGLISAFVERWHRDTNSFHLPIGEMTITLDDVSSLLHIPITSAFFSVNIFNKDDVAELLGELIGVSLADAYAEFNLMRTTTVRYSWLLDVYHQRCAYQHW
uniref:Protein MAIN-LIKE 1-like n=1 Tax=Cicer arietinum TaxID=3827 RepID=A0A3Q7WW66_CICAR|nr:protein MAIN-LIKE 1-like [Cicer arietinum]